MFISENKNPEIQGKILLDYMYTRITEQMRINCITTATSLILLKDWDLKRSNFIFRYWEEDFLGYLKNLMEKDQMNEIEWVILEAGLHGRDKKRKEPNGAFTRLIRVHLKHNQIFTDHDIPNEAIKMSFKVNPLSWEKLLIILDQIESLLEVDVTNIPTQLPLIDFIE